MRLPDIEFVGSLIFFAGLFFFVYLQSQMGRINNISKRLFAALMLLLFMEYILSATVFLHQHTIDGQTFTHSHIFFGTKETPNHTHTQQQINLISAMSAVKILAVAIALFCAILTPVGRRFVVYVVHIFKRRLRHIISMRAPPAVVLY